MNRNKEDKSLSRPEDTFMSLRDAMNRLFDESFWAPFESFGEFSPARSAFPRINLSENEDEVKVSADLPGINPEDVNIEVDEDSLTISGEIEREEKENDEEVYRYERSYGRFQRAIPIPTKINPDDVEASSKNGVIEIILPKTEKTKKKKVKIESK